MDVRSRFLASDRYHHRPESSIRPFQDCDGVECMCLDCLTYLETGADEF